MSDVTEEMLAMNTPQMKQALQELLFQLADDDFLFAFRASEWLGLVPHIEEDVASSSIAQDTMGHAAMYYQLLEDLGVGKADDLAHLRSAEERRNCILVERVNGQGHYMDTPRYDWAYNVVRSFFYTQAKKVKVDALCHSSYEPLRAIAIKIKMELYYHDLHWKVWFEQLMNSTEEAKEKMKNALDCVVRDLGDVCSYGDQKQAIERYQFSATEEKLKEHWLNTLQPILNKCQLTLPQISPSKQNGRNGEHTADLTSAIATLSEVYRLHPATNW